MKKKLREQLRLLAQQIIEKEETFQTSQIKKSVLDLYNQLVVLEYLKNQIDDTISESIEESLDSKSFREENWFTEPEPVPQPSHKEDIVEPLMEKIKDIVAQMPQESERLDEFLNNMLPQRNEETFTPKPQPTISMQKEVEPPALKVEQPEHSIKDVEQTPPKIEHPTPEKTAIPAVKQVRNELEEFASAYQKMPEFERKNPELFPPSTGMRPASKNVSESRSKSLNDSINKGLTIGLNDRLAFVKHLFEGQTEDYTRVLSQINTMDSFEEAERFIVENVKPDYHNWQNKEVYSERFMLIIEKSFN